MRALARRAAIACPLAALVLAATPALARAAAYQVRVCRDAAGAGFEGAVYANHAFAWVSDPPGPTGTMGGGDSCGGGGNSGGELSMAAHGTTPTGTYAGWQATAPVPLRLRGLSVDRSLYAFGPAARAWSVQAHALTAGGWQPLELCWRTDTPCALGGRTSFALGSDTTAVRYLVWCQTGLADQECYSDGGASAASLFLHGATLTVDDPTDPTLEVGGGGLVTDGATVTGAATATFTATDPDSGIRWVELAVDAQVVDSHSYPGDHTSFRPYASTRSGQLAYDTARLANGRHEVTVRAYNAAADGVTVHSAVVTVDNPKTGSPAGAQPGASTQLAHAILVAEFADHSQRRVVRYGRPVTVTGRLTDASGVPIAGARLDVRELGHEPGASARDTGQVVTDSDGRWRYVAGIGGSRDIVVVYRPEGRDLALADRTQVTLLVRAAATLRVAPGRIRNGQAVRVYGRLRGRPYPVPGILVTLQGRPRRGGAWRTFAVARTRSDGRFAHRYRFTRVRARTRFLFRARIARQAVYPYEPATSRRVGATVSG
jgi:hypothetical protein